MTTLFELDNLYLSTGDIDHIIYLMDSVNRESMIQLKPIYLDQPHLSRFYPYLMW